MRLYNYILGGETPQLRVATVRLCTCTFSGELRRVAIVRLWPDGEIGRCCHTFLVDQDTSTPRRSSEKKGRRDRKGYTGPSHREVASRKFIVNYTCRAVELRNRTLHQPLTPVAEISA